MRKPYGECPVGAILILGSPCGRVPFQGCKTDRTTCNDTSKKKVPLEWAFSPIGGDVCS